jgi:hypothetical protein
MITPLKVTTLAEIIDVATRTKKVYDNLTPEQKKEVDDYNVKLIEAVDSDDLATIRTIGPSPMLAHMERAGK